MGFRKQRKANKGERKPDKDENFDLPVTKDDFDSVPRSFARIFNYKKEQEEKPKEKKNSNEKKETNKPKLELRKGEKLRDFKSRVERVYQKEIAQTVKSVKSVTERKRRNRQQRKLKAQMKKKRKRGEDDDDDIRDFDKLRDEVKFGEVADAPPVFKRIPKARGRGKEVLDKKTKEALGNESEEDENMKQLKASHKRKLQNMSASARKALEDERQRAIDMYRAKKAKKMAEAGLTPLS